MRLRPTFYQNPPLASGHQLHLKSLVVDAWNLEKIETIFRVIEIAKDEFFYNMSVSCLTLIIQLLRSTTTSTL